MHSEREAYFHRSVPSRIGLRDIISLKHSAEGMRLPLKAQHRISRAAPGFLRKQTAGIGSCILLKKEKKRRTGRKPRLNPPI